MLTSPPPHGPPVGAVPDGRRRPPRPRWGLGDVALAVPVTVLGVVIAVVPMLLFLAVAGDDTDRAEQSSALVAVSLFGQQSAQAAWPVLVARWKGFGAIRDFRLRVQPVDVAIGVGVGLGLLLASGLVSALVQVAVGLDDLAESSNNGLLEEASGSPWQLAIIFGVVLGAPFSEELLFRGLVLRAFEKKWNAPVGVMASTTLFTVVHYTGAGWQGTVVLFSAIATIGLGLALVTVKTDRLGAAMVAHVSINATATVATLAVG